MPRGFAYSFRWVDGCRSESRTLSCLDVCAAELECHATRTHPRAGSRRGTTRGDPRIHPGDTVEPVPCDSAHHFRAALALVGRAGAADHVDDDVLEATLAALSARLAAAFPAFHPARPEFLDHLPRPPPAIQAVLFPPTFHL